MRPAWRCTYLHPGNGQSCSDQGMGDPSPDAGDGSRAAAASIPDMSTTARRARTHVVAHLTVTELVAIRYGRMLVSPFTFYRGAARIMAHDLAPTPRSGLRVQCCGDAHLSNVGGYA